MRRNVCTAICSDRGSPVRTLLAQEDLQGGRLGELGSPAEATMGRIVLPLEEADRLVQERGARLRVAVRPGLPAWVRRCKGVEEFRRAAANVVRPLPVGPPRSFQDLPERRDPMTRLGWEVGPAVEGVAFRCEEHRQRPPPLARHRLDRAHVHLVHVRPLLPIDLHVHEGLVHERRHRRVFEGLPLHHVAPVAGRIPDGEQDGSFRGRRPVLGLGPPGVPVHGVFGVLQQVGAGLVGQTVGHGEARVYEGLAGLTAHTLGGGVGSVPSETNVVRAWIPL